MQASLVNLGGHTDAASDCSLERGQSAEQEGLLSSPKGSWARPLFLGAGSCAVAHQALEVPSEGSYSWLR